VSPEQQSQVLPPDAGAEDESSLLLLYQPPQLHSSDPILPFEPKYWDDNAGDDREPQELVLHGGGVVRGQRRALVWPIKANDGHNKAMLRRQLQNIFMHKASKSKDPPPPPPGSKSKKSLKGGKGGKGGKSKKAKGAKNCSTKGGKGKGKGGKSKKSMKGSKFLCSSAPSPRPTRRMMPTPRPSVMNMNMTVANMTMAPTKVPSTRQPTGKPTFELTGGAAERLAKLTPPGMTCFVHLTITDEYPYAQAQVIIEALPAGPTQ